MAGKYNLITEYVGEENVLDDIDGVEDISSNTYAVVAVVRLGKPLSYSRVAGKSDPSVDLSEGARTRAKTLIIVDDIVNLQIQGAKESHLKSLSVSLIQTDFNYLLEILPGDWILSWIVHGQEKLNKLLTKIRQGAVTNKWEDGLGFKFVGRVESCRKRGSVDRGSGVKTTRYAVQAAAFRELDTQFFYDPSLRKADDDQISTWLSYFGIQFHDLFPFNGANAQKQFENNVHLIIPTLFEVLVGKGVGAGINPDAGTQGSQSGFAGGGEAAEGVSTTGTREAQFAYLVPEEVGALIGRSSRSKTGGILAYADIVDLIFGVQKYDASENAVGYRVFLPTIDKNSSLTTAVGNHRYTGIELQGANVPIMPSFDNRPLWDICTQYLNKVMNEMYTCMRVNEQGLIVPTVMLRQMPFTTRIVANKIDGARDTAGVDASINYTTYDSLPRWQLPGVMVYDYDVGRSDATRVNFVHVYPQMADISGGLRITEMLSENPPVKDNVDIQRSGLFTYMTTVPCTIGNQIKKVPTLWMEIIADHRIGSQYTLNGTISMIGISAPICEGDNLEFDGVVYHIEAYTHAFSVDAGTGARSFQTSLSLTNGMRQDDLGRAINDDGGGDGSTPAGDVDVSFPIYPGFAKDDNTKFDPQATLDTEPEPEPESDSLNGRHDSSIFDPNKGTA